MLTTVQTRVKVRVFFNTVFILQATFHDMFNYFNMSILTILLHTFWKNTPFYDSCLIVKNTKTFITNITKSLLENAFSMDTWHSPYYESGTDILVTTKSFLY